MGEAALKAIKKMGKQWVAGKNRGEAVRVRMNVPVSFRLPDDEEENVMSETPEIYTVVDEMPRFEGCSEIEAVDAQKCTFEKLTRYILDNMQYPEEAKEAGVEGIGNGPGGPTTTGCYRKRFGPAFGWPFHRMGGERRQPGGAPDDWGTDIGIRNPILRASGKQGRHGQRR